MSDPWTEQKLDLPSRMRLRANRDGLAANHELRRLADAAERAAEGFYAAKQSVPVASFVGAWARARKAWCAYTGEPL